MLPYRCLQIQAPVDIEPQNAFNHQTTNKPPQESCFVPQYHSTRPALQHAIWNLQDFLLFVFWLSSPSRLSHRLLPLPLPLLLLLLLLLLAPSSAFYKCAAETMASDRLTPIQNPQIPSTPSDSEQEPLHHRNPSIFSMSTDQISQLEKGQPPTQDYCVDRSAHIDSNLGVVSTKKFAGQTVAPFLARHIPEQYAPMGVTPQLSTTSRKDPNTKWCYRHSPDSKCRRTTDEPTMENLQWVRALSLLPSQTIWR